MIFFRESRKDGQEEGCCDQVNGGWNIARQSGEETSGEKNAYTAPGKEKKWLGEFIDDPKKQEDCREKIACVFEIRFVIEEMEFSDE